ncbi:MAG: hypothetical protein AAFU41_01160 [Pseudomonadota bacterium]
MGPVRRRLILATLLLLPGAAWAEVCDKERPGWDGTPVGAFGELLYLLQTPVVLVLILGTALAIRFRSEKGGLAVVVGWSIVTFLTTGIGRTDAVRAAGIAEGCIGSPALFIAVAAALSVGVVLYTAPLPRQKSGE